MDKHQLSSQTKEYKLELVAPTVFKVWRASPFKNVKEEGKYINWAITSDRCIHQLVLSDRKRYSHSKIGKSWDTLTAFSREQSFENYLARLLEEGWQLVPTPKKKPPKLPLFPPLHSKGKKPQNIYEAFTPEALLEAAESEEVTPLEVLEVKETVRERVTPVIRHLPGSLERSVDKLELLIRDEDLKRRIQERKDKRILTREQAKRLKELDRLIALALKQPKPLFSEKSAPRNFTSKQDMLNYIKDRIKR